MNPSFNPEKKSQSLEKSLFIQEYKRVVLSQLKELEDIQDPTIDEKKALQEEISKKTHKKEELLGALDMLETYIKNKTQDNPYDENIPSLQGQIRVKIKLIEQDIESLERRKDFNKEEKINQLLEELSGLE